MLDPIHKLYICNANNEVEAFNLYDESANCVGDLVNQSIDSNHYIVVNTVDGLRVCPLSHIKQSSGMTVVTYDGERYLYNKKNGVFVYATSELEDTSGGYGTSFKERIKINSYMLNVGLYSPIVIKVYDKDKKLKIERTINQGVTEVVLDSPESFTQDYDKSTRGQYYVKVYSKADYEEKEIRVESSASGMVIYIDMTSSLILDDLNFLDFSKDEFYQVINGMELKGNMTKGLDSYRCQANPPQVAGLWWYNMQSKIRIRNSDEAIASGLPEYNVYSGDWTLYMPGGTGDGYGEGNFTWTVRRYTGSQKDFTNKYYGSSYMGSNNYLAFANLDNI